MLAGSSGMRGGNLSIKMRWHHAGCKPCSEAKFMLWPGQRARAGHSHATAFALMGWQQGGWCMGSKDLGQRGSE